MAVCCDWEMAAEEPSPLNQRGATRTAEQILRVEARRAAQMEKILAACIVSGAGRYV